MNLDELPEIECAPEQVTAYRQLLLGSLQAVRSYTGTEISNDELVEILGRLDSWMGANFGGGAGRVADEVEAAISLEARRTNINYITITELIDRAIHRLGRTLRADQTPLEIAEALGIRHRQLPGILIPPDKKEAFQERGERNVEMAAVQFRPRLQTLIRELQTEGIFTDDLTGVRLNS